MDDGLLAEQIEYYRRRASEYDETAYGDVDAAQARIARIIGTLPAVGHAVELACGTGMWTQALASKAGQLTAVDAAPEALALARTRVPAPHVEFVCADVFEWRAPMPAGLVFFCAWLSHVPAPRRRVFLTHVRGLLSGGGQLVIVDEQPASPSNDATPSADGRVERRLRDGTKHALVKVSLDPDALRADLTACGFTDIDITPDGDDWFILRAIASAFLSDT